MVAGHMVEMALLDTARRAEWDAWYLAHQHRLLSIPGFRASQRFEAIHVAESPFVTFHEVDGGDVFASPAYRARAGPSTTGEWRTTMGPWHRNLFSGLDHTPEIPMDARLVVVEQRRRLGGAGRPVGGVVGGRRAREEAEIAQDVSYARGGEEAFHGPGPSSETLGSRCASGERGHM
jgi:hypothetical protein